MASSVQGIDLPEKRLLEILEIANDWALSNGIIIKDSPGSAKAVCAPYSLFPSLVPAPILAQAKSSMTEFSRLMHKVANDHAFLADSLKNVIEVDPFIKGIWRIYQKVREAGIKQPLMLGVFRNDFMMNFKDKSISNGVVKPDQLELKQIEFNSIASSFGGLTQQIGNLHKLTLGLCGKKYSDKEMPENKPASGIAKGLLRGWELYNNPQAVIIFLVSDNERNVFDQRWIEFRIYDQNPNVRVLRRTFLDFHHRGSLDSENKLFIDEEEVAVVYMRDGYTADQYPSEKEWNGRLTIELSSAIKCPCVQYQLMGSKKVQQELAKPGAVEKFVASKNSADMLRATFAGLYSLDLGPEGDEAVEMAVNSPEKFVMKPQREGGGNNLYNTEIAKFMSEHKNSKERNAYILMERIFPWQQQNYLVKSGVPFVLSDVVSEIGVYGVYIGSDQNEVENFECGHMMRTKMSGTDEGGVVAGFAVLDTPLIY
ncbi:hypothetical protein RRG08_044113 [Elysia crispata]|uniref:Glutathione synthetase n=1 Tax=Elysia crispata TaxID=231223 RepID=A0AAE0Z7P5_9GAST|nr:hypothetical protein RRG08_044113 [Elysia crispata]